MAVINAGWLTDFKDIKFAPKTLFSQVYVDNPETGSITDLNSYFTTFLQKLDDRDLQVDLTSDSSVKFKNPGAIGVDGILNIANGGTGNTTFTDGTLITYDSTRKRLASVVLSAVDSVSGTKKTVIQSNDGVLSALLAHSGNSGGTIVLRDSSGNFSAGTITATLSGNASSATEFKTNKSVTLTGDVTGTASSKAGWSIETTISAGAVTNDKLANSKITIAGTDVSLGGSITAATLKSNLGLGDRAYDSTTYLPLSGGTLTGNLDFLAENKDMFITWKYSNTNTSASWRLGYVGTGAGNANYFAIESTASDSGDTWNRAMQIGMNDLAVTFAGNITATKVYGAVWNDYAEYRMQTEIIKPGYCVVSHNNGQVSKTTKRYQACDGIVSDTFGFAIGETDKCKTPLAVAGRVLAYCEGDRYSYQAGDTVCAGPDGKVCKMTREEIQLWPDRVIGIVSEIPEYDTWGTGNVKVNGRIWIKIK